MKQLWKYFENGRFRSAVGFWNSGWSWDIPFYWETGPIRNWGIKTILQVENDGFSVQEVRYEVIDAGG